MPVIDLELLPVAACHRPDYPGMRPVPDGHSLDRLTVVRAREVRVGDLVAGDVGSRVHPEGTLRWTTHLCAPFVAQPGPYEADCPSCRAWTAGGEGPWVTLYPHCPERADALITIVPPAEPWAAAVARPCVNDCSCRNGRVPLERAPGGYPVPWPVCWDCHGRACEACRQAGGSVH